MNYVEILIGAVAAFLLGFGWYTAVFGKAWQQETGITAEEAQKDMLRTHLLAFVMMAILAYAINTIIGYHSVEEQTFAHGAFHGMMVALMYCLPAIAIQYLYQRKSLKLFAIDAGYVLTFCTLMGAIMAALHLG